MIQVETDRPVYSNAIGDGLRKRLTPEQKEARRKRLGSKAKNVYSKAKESGILSGLENLALGNNPANSNQTNNELPPVAPTTSWWSTQTKTTKTLIVTSSLLVVGLSVWYFGFRKSPAKGK